MYKYDFNITIIDYKGAIVSMPNKSSHTASSQTTSQLVNEKYYICTFFLLDRSYLLSFVTGPAKIGHICTQIFD